MQKQSLNLGESQPKMIQKILKEVIVDRKSKYTVVARYIENKEELDSFITTIKKDKYFSKATHNSYAYRIQNENGSILEGKNDDGETGAGLCILREIQRAEYVNVVIIVTRFYGGIHLQNDRFKHVINASKQILKEI